MGLAGRLPTGTRNAEAMSAVTKSLLALVAAIAIVASAYYFIATNHTVSGPASLPPPIPQAMKQAAPAPVPAPAQPKSDCLLPGPPPVPPDGNTASAADMALGHATIQTFVNELENYQACRNYQLDHAAPTITDAQKQTWLDEGNAAVDQANAIAGAFAAQLKIFKARTPKP
jgi:hypothetical protein